MADYEMTLTPEGKAAFKTLDALDGATIRVGWQSSGMTVLGKNNKPAGSQPLYGMERNSDGKIVQSELTLAEIAMYNERGTSTSPARPFLKPSFESNKDYIESLMTEGLSKIAVSGKVKEFLQTIGVELVSLAQEEIEDGHFEPNSKAVYDRKKKLSSKDAKGEPKPLIDTATMKNSIGFMIEEG